MAQFKFEHIEPGATITAGDLNSVFAGLKANTDGTTSRIDAENTRSAVITRQHLAAGSVHQEFTVADTGASVTHTSGTGGAATTWQDILTVTLSNNPALASGDVLRWHFFCLIRGVVETGAAGTPKAQQLYYLRVQATINDGGGDTTLEITPPYGYSLANRSSNEANTGGANGWRVANFCRNALAGIWINRQAGRLFKAVRLQLLMNVNDDAGTANTVTTGQTTGFAVVERL